MKLPGFVPDELRQLLQFVPSTGWDAVEWRPLLRSLRQLSTRYVTGQGVAGVRRALASELSSVTLEKRLSSVRSLDELSGSKEKTLLGDGLLRLYFTQWRVDEGLFIDLRSRFLGMDSSDRLHFAPNGLWVKLRPEFREGMLALYLSFYNDDDEAFESALRSMGMLRQGLATDDAETLKSLLRAHFGLDQRAQTFSIDAFKASFDELFSFFIQHNYKLHSDFVFAGFCLITLYMTLEQGGQAHNVRAICAEALSENPG